MALMVTLVAASCEEDPVTEGVDLRYEELGKLEVEDAYVFKPNSSHSNGVLTELQLRVKSDHDWAIKGGEEASWCKISPSSGSAGEPVVITITCDDNTSLDDRSVTLDITSDYWTGHTFTLAQKGIAILDYSVAGETPELPGVRSEKEEGTAIFSVLSNQRWTAEITEGTAWLSFADFPGGQASGGEDYNEASEDVTLSFTANKGEERVGKIVIYDRNKEAVNNVEVLCTQAGIILIPTIPEIGYYKQKTVEAHSLEIPVESNGEWSVSVEDENDDWISFETIDFNGSGVIRANLETNDEAAIREATILLSTPEVEGAEKVVKSVIVKQANDPALQTVIFDAAGLASWNGTETIASIGDTQSYFKGSDISTEDVKPGLYRITITSFDDATAAPYLFLEYCSADEAASKGKTAQHEIRIKFNDNGRPYWTFVTPWGYTAPNVNNWCVGTGGTNAGLGPIDYSKEHTLCLQLDRYVDPDTGEDVDAFKIYYIFDGVKAHSFITDGGPNTPSDCGGAVNGRHSAFQIPYIGTTFRVKIGNASAASGCYISKYEYKPNVDWGD